MLKRQHLFVEYIPAVEKAGNQHYVEYYVLNPNTDKLEQKRVKLNRIKKRLGKRAFDAYVRILIATINDRLAKGWNPFLENAAPKAMHRMSDVLNTFIKAKQLDLEPDSMRSYESFVEIFRTYINKVLKKPDMMVCQFTNSEASDFILYISHNRAKTQRTYNNYIAFFRIMFNWMVEYNYSSVNPFEKIKRKKEKEKRRKPMEADSRKKLLDYLERENPNFLVICMLCYYCFIRPKEIGLLRVGDIKISEMVIKVSESIAKNDNESFRTIPDSMIPYLLKLNLSAPVNEYLFAKHAGYSFAPGKVPVNSKYVGKYWEKLRKELNIPKNISFYSLKDSGIAEMLMAGVPINLVQAQADHSSEEITRIYYKTKTKKAEPLIRKQSSKF